MWYRAKECSQSACVLYTDPRSEILAEFVPVQQPVLPSRRIKTLVYLNSQWIIVQINLPFVTVSAFIMPSLTGPLHLLCVTYQIQFN